MKCPVCKEVNLVMSERQGIEIDYCPECRGVWLDRGELDKIIAKTESQMSSVNENNTRNNDINNRSYVEHNDYNAHKNSNYNQKDHSHNNYNNQYMHKGKKKESFISNVFDIFGD